MGVYTCTVSCRMTEEDRQLLDQRAESLELANSEAIRALLRLPIADPDDLVAIDAGSRVVVIDAKTMGRINRELEAEQAETLGISAAEWELLRTMRQLSSGHVTVTVKKGEIKAIRTQEPPRAETTSAAVAAAL